MTKTRISPNWKLGMASGVAIGLGFGTTVGDLLLGLAMAGGLGTALSYAFGAKDADRAATERAEAG
ncbi:hypothetical protein [Nonomuraea sp. SBT364]|uniref:hypothetical protein n=1 Tax=Nonomuraea sp. SBT364 TaxID=1580530 RepID=UPI0007C68357|nr:hypothetical protein [Nonomuraea sp. SBT364]